MFLTFLLKGTYAFSSSSDSLMLSGMTSYYSMINPSWVSLEAPDVNSPAKMYLSDVRADSLSVWRFSFRMYVNPSSSNMIRIFLLADSTLTNGLNVAIGDTKDNIVLTMTKDGKKSKLILSEEKILDSDYSSLNVKVCRTLIDDTDSAKYELYFDNADSQQFIGSCSISLTETKGLDYVGISTSYTKTRASGVFQIGDFHFTGSFDTSTSKPGDDNVVNPDTGEENDSTIVPEPMPEPLPNPEPEPEPDDDTDVTPDTPSLSTDYYRGCVIINEFMPKPVADGNLPAEEYIELLNMSDKAVDLEGWRISTKNVDGVLPSFVLSPGACITLCAKSKTAVFEEICDVISPSAWPTITNENCRLVLRNADGLVSDYVDYDIGMYNESYKESGGWALERINGGDLSGMSSAWAPSNDKRGGTPGERNSVYSDVLTTVSPQIESVTLDAKGLELCVNFTQAIDTTAISRHIVISGVKTYYTAFQAEEVTLKSITFYLDEALASNTTYLFSLPSFAGLSSDENSDGTEYKIGIPTSDVMGKVIINEIMPTSTTDADYVELYNHSNDILDLSEIYFCRVVDGVIKKMLPISSATKCFFPGDYLVITKDADKVISSYEAKHAHLVCNVASFTDLAQSGEIGIALATGEFIDRLAYDMNMHSELIADFHDKALERIKRDIPTNVPSNWTTAAAFDNYATPTELNSQCRDNTDASSADEVSLACKVITPDGDGIDDRLVVQCNVGDGEWYVTMIIYDASGHSVATPYNNVSVPVMSELYWDGNTNEGAHTAPGTYIVYLKMWQTQGETKVFKKSCVVAYPSDK